MNRTLTDTLLAKTCKPCKEGTPPLQQDAITGLLQALNGWKHHGDEITHTFQFGNYYETIAFVNAVAWLSHREDHHPEMIVSYNRCLVSYSTHSIGGLSENDFICAAKIDCLLG